MTNIAIRVDHLTKRYHIGRAQQRHDALRDALEAVFSSQSSVFSRQFSVVSFQSSVFSRRPPLGTENCELKTVN